MSLFLCRDGIYFPTLAIQIGLVCFGKYCDVEVMYGISEARLHEPQENKYQNHDDKP